MLYVYLLQMILHQRVFEFHPADTTQTFRVSAPYWDGATVTYAAATVTMRPDPGCGRWSAQEKPDSPDTCELQFAFDGDIDVSCAKQGKSNIFICTWKKPQPSAEKP